MRTIEIPITSLAIPRMETTKPRIAGLWFLLKPFLALGLKNKLSYCRLGY
jgi:hypothetical protein